MAIEKKDSRCLFLGRATLDVLYWLDRLPEEDSKAYARRFRAAPGGPALNAAITHALLGRQSVAGGETMLLCAMGGGPWAAAVQAVLRERGIRLLDLAAGSDFQLPLTTVLINAEKSTRTIVNPPLAEIQLAKLPPDWERAAPLDWGPAPSIALTDGFHLAETLPLLRALRASGSLLCFDGGSWKPGTDELAPLLTAAICSERFQVPELAGRAKTNLEENPESHPESIFAYFAARGVPYVAITRGSRAILASDRGRRFTVEIEAVTGADTLGAGDVLHGAFCHFFARHGNFETALSRAAQIATRSCRGLGIEAWTETRTEA